jgi:ketosteroid isomerase-like protein
MSRENGEIVRRLYQALARRDAVTPFELSAEDIVWDVSQSRTAFLYTRPVSTGHKGQGWREWLSAFSAIDAEVQELIYAAPRSGNHPRARGWTRQRCAGGGDPPRGLELCRGPGHPHAALRRPRAGARSGGAVGVGTQQETSRRRVSARTRSIKIVTVGPTKRLPLACRGRGSPVSGCEGTLALRLVAARVIGAVHDTLGPRPRRKPRRASSQSRSRIAVAGCSVDVDPLGKRRSRVRII